MEVRTLDSLPEYLRAAIADPTHGRRTRCPTCGGGSSKEESLSIFAVDNEDDMVKVSCWRSTCGYWGYVMLDGTVKFVGKHMKEARPFDRPTIPIQGAAKLTLRRDYGLSQSVMERRGWRLLQDAPETLVMPIKDRHGQELGHVTRTLPTSNGQYFKKRVDTFKCTAQPFLDAWISTAEAPLVIVEDCLSAARLASIGLNAVALLGTNMSTADARAIKEIVFYDTNKTCFLALDEDAWDKSLKFAGKFAHILTMLPVPLTVDIKDMADDHDIHELFRG